MPTKTKPAAKDLRPLATHTSAVYNSLVFDNDGHTSVWSIEYINVNSTIAVVSTGWASRTKYHVVGITGTKVDAKSFSKESYPYVRRDFVFRSLSPRSFRNKTEARKFAQNVVLQDDSKPFDVTLEGTAAPVVEVAIARAVRSGESGYYGFDAIPVPAPTPDEDGDINTYSYGRAVENATRQLTQALGDAEGFGVDPYLLALAVVEGRLTYSTPPVAAPQVSVVVNDTKTGVLSEHLVSAQVEASGEVEGIGRIVHTGSLLEFYTSQRANHADQGVANLLETRRRLLEALSSISNSVERITKEVEDGRVNVGSFGRLNLGSAVEEVNGFAAEYLQQALNLDVPQEFLGSLTKGTWSKDRYGHTDAVEALRLLQGRPERSR